MKIIFFCSVIILFCEFILMREKMSFLRFPNALFYLFSVSMSDLELNFKSPQNFFHDNFLMLISFRSDVWWIFAVGACRQAGIGSPLKKRTGRRPHLLTVLGRFTMKPHGTWWRKKKEKRFSTSLICSRLLLLAALKLLNQFPFSFFFCSSWPLSFSPLSLSGKSIESESAKIYGGNIRDGS